MITLDLKLELKERLGVELEKVEQLCQEWEIIELALFGSIVRDDFNLNSDIDCLVTFQTENNISLLDLETLEEQLENLFNRPVDIITKKSIEKSHNWIRRQNILENAEVIYVKR